jgi:opacity protein-like surface antigen
MKKILLTAVMALITIVAQAQNTQRETGTFTLQPMLGASFGYLSGDWVSAPGEKKKLIAGIVVGVEGEYYATKWLGISAGMNYTMQGWRLDYPERSVLTRLNYLNFPVMANIYVVKGLSLKTGAQFGWLLNAKDRVDDVNIDIKDDCNGFCFAIPLGLAYEFDNFVFDARYNFALSNAINKVNERKRSQLIQLTFGYKFSL